MSQAESIYTAFLGEHSEAYDYLVKNRGLSDLVISRFSVGYAPDGYQNLTSAFPYYGADRVLQDAGLVKKSERTGTFYRSEEHTSELQSLMRISYAVFCLQKKQTHPYRLNTYSIDEY